MLGFFVPGAAEVIIIALSLAVVIGFIAGGVALFHTISSRGTSRPLNPNLMPCPDCGHAVSIKASKCPKCGCPIDTDTR
jgi:hypothetical protein